MATIKTELCIEHGRDACFMIKTDACAVHVPMDEMGDLVVSLRKLRQRAAIRSYQQRERELNARSFELARQVLHESAR